eukprot:TRINITY_DN12421_c1_g10_i1.p1 TRINITY_DN12421_c1_g10~~TRINITY_DN12421_c1_g10_i1.p1  ORF type:complete len:341 (+),score=29.07 TRINITY_DN12421_c1_g10_i1:472-1494(+)
MEVAEFLLDSGADMEARDADESTPLLGTCKFDAAKAKMLINRGANVHATDKKGQTTLINACHLGDPELVGMLIERGVNVNSVHENGETALSIAARHEHTAILERLLAAGANANTSRKSALIGAASLGRVRAVQLLLEAGADVTARNESGGTPLHLTAHLRSHGSDLCSVASLLIAAGADPKARDESGSTPFHAYFECWHVALNKALISLLSRAGADPHCRNEAGRAPIEMFLQSRELHQLYVRDIVLPAQWSGNRGSSYQGALELCNIDRKWLQQIIFELDAEPIRLMYFDRRFWNNGWKVCLGPRNVFLADACMQQWQLHTCFHCVNSCSRWMSCRVHT